MKGCIVTIDAMACQHDIVKKLAKKKVDYVICVKSNQGKLHDTLREWFGEIDMEGNRINGHGHIPPTRYRMSYTENSGHGRHELRYCQVITVAIPHACWVGKGRTRLSARRA